MSKDYIVNAVYGLDLEIYVSLSNDSGYASISDNSDISIERIIDEQIRRWHLMPMQERKEQAPE